MPPRSKDPWTRALRNRVMGTASPHALDTPALTPALPAAWKALRACFAQAPARREYTGAAQWVARCQQVELELAAPNPPAQLDLNVEYAREQVLYAMLVDTKRPDKHTKPVCAALASLRVRVGGARFVVDYLTKPPPLEVTGHYAPGRTPADGGYQLVFEHNPREHAFASPTQLNQVWERQNLRRQLFALPEAEFAPAAAYLRELLTFGADTKNIHRWDHLRAALYVFGRDPTLAEPLVTLGLKSAEPINRPPHSFARFCVEPSMLACLRDPALAETLVRRRERDEAGNQMAVEYVTDMVNTLGSKSLTTLSVLSQATHKSEFAKLLESLLTVASELP